MVSNGLPNGVYVQQSPTGLTTGLKSKTPHGVPCLLLTSIFQLVLGVLSASFGIAAIFMENFFYYSGYAVWSGVLVGKLLNNPHLKKNFRA